MSSFRSKSSRLSYVAGYALLLTTFAALILMLLIYRVPRASSEIFLATLGLIGAWRYTWQAVHFMRACFYQFVAFPMRRRAVRAHHQASHVYVVVLSYRMGAATNATVYGALVADLRRLGRPATVVACITDDVDVQTLEALGDSGCVEIVPLLQTELGKRDAMERALSYLADSNPPPGAVVTLMDGDTVVELGTFERTLPVLLDDARLGAVTTDNVPYVDGTTLAREWYRLRMRDRHQLMCSMSLSNRVLVLTGRFAVFRAEIALTPGFIAAVGNDGFYHRHAGRIGLLTGDDKSTWFHTLQQGWHMIYIPDVAVGCLEKLPYDDFRKSTVALMHRYFGNMTRSNLRSIQLMPGRVGLFTWLALVDQRLSPWSTLWGPLLAVMVTLLRDGSFVFAYLLWVLTTRTVQSLICSLARPSFHPLFPFLQFYNQVVGAALKVHSFFHPDRQAWTRQGTGFAGALSVPSSTYLMWLSLSVLGIGSMMAAGGG